MKKIAATILAAICAVAVLTAGNVYDRSTVTLPTTSGYRVFTNTVNYAALKITGLLIESSTDAGSTVTVKQLFIADNAYTRVVASSGKGATYPTNWYLKPSDTLMLSNSTATGAVMTIEYEVQKH